jgi:hypothetical protein
MKVWAEFNDILANLDNRGTNPVYDDCLISQKSKYLQE